MIPTPKQCFSLWNTYHVPKKKQRHLYAVWAVVCVMEEAAKKQHIDLSCALLDAATLLHDIDKAVPQLEGEQHPDACIRIMKKHGFDELIPLVRSHPLHAILDETIAPKTMEEKMLYIADKITKYRPIGLLRRFSLWRKESLTQEQRVILERAFEPARALAFDLFHTIGVSEREVIALSAKRLKEGVGGVVSYDIL